MAKFSPGDIVIDLQTNEKGVVCEICPPARGKQFYRVRFAETIETCLEQYLDGLYDIANPFDRARKGIYGNRDQFVLVNTTYKINNSNNNTISSLKASKTLFKAYQFKPLLKFLNSQTRRILIADEVGLGKTIEAGHILLELKARGEFKTALIVCPNSLKIKWQTELQEKFGLNFKIYESLNDAVEDLKSHPQNARGILNYEKIRAKKEENEKDGKNNSSESSSNKLIEYLHTGRMKYSIILCDEAHKMRNHETQTYRGMSEILQYADAAVFLTATPIMLGDDDLYNLLHLLEPIYFDNREVFKNLINANRPFIQAKSMLNSNQPLGDIKELLSNGEIIKSHRIGENYYYESTKKVYDTYKGIRLYEKILEDLDKEDTPMLRAQLQEDISGMSKINNVFSRTRKREVSTEERQQTERDAHRKIVTLSTEERDFYDGIIDDYIEKKGGLDYDEYGEEVLPPGAILGIIQRKRMVASSVQGYRLYTESAYDVEKFCQRVETEKDLKDSKIETLREIIDGVKSAGGTKLIVFSIFKFTVRYLSIRLKELGYRVFAIHGDIKERESIIQQFRSCPEFAILLSTEVGSEGLDMQFCSHLVNYDLPWNPMVVEQRIGRIDRFGQKSPKVHIYNLVVADSIQEVIYTRLLERIGVFQGVIGDLEMILEENGKAIRQLERDIYGMHLSKEEQEKKVIDLTKALETEKIQLNQVEEGMTNALTNDIYIQNEISKIRNNRLYVTEEELKNYIKMLINEHLKTCLFERVNENEYSLQIPQSTPKVVSNFLISHQPQGDDFEELFRTYKQRIMEDFLETSSRRITFDQAYAFENKSVDFVNIYNPLIIAASVYFKDSLSSIGNTFQLKYKLPEDIRLNRGEYFMAVYSVKTQREILGKKVSSETLVPVFYNVAEDFTIRDLDLNINLFGKIQEGALNLAADDKMEAIGDEKCSNMECDFTLYISEHIAAQKEDMAIRDDSQKELYIRQLNEYYEARIQKEEKNIKSAKADLELIPDNLIKEINHAKNILQLAENRLKMLEKSKEEALAKANSSKAPEISSKMISLNRIIFY